ncbi:MAG TPA: T9SS type A sorting domain-containing protein, partial [Saprospiraceae bacterium]|nr:T9SS type A sorting domain-containing protein [Saprospiraceae bacterium]
LFPVGTAAFYAPAQLSLAGNSKSGRLEVNVLPNVWQESNSGKDLSLTQPLVDATWNIEVDTVIQNMNMTAELMWPVLAEANNFDRNNAYLSSYTGGKWDKSTVGPATLQSNGMYSMKRQNMSNTAPLAVFGKNAVTAVNNLFTGTFSAYPNPATSTIYVYNAGINTGINNAEIINLSGQLVKSIKLNNSKEGIALDDLNPGNYIIRISGKDTNEIIQFIKQ